MPRKSPPSNAQEDSFMLQRIDRPKDAEDARRGMAKMFGPGHVDHLIRQCIQACWMALPPQRQNPEEVTQEIRRLVDRALKDLAEDSKAFELQ